VNFTCGASKIILFIGYYQCDRIKGDEMSGIFSTNGGYEKVIENSNRKFGRETDHLEDVVVDGRMMLKLNLKALDVKI
jgi:hypothetical protein